MCTAGSLGQTDGDKVERALRQPEGGHEAREERNGTGSGADLLRKSQQSRAPYR